MKNIDEKQLVKDCLSRKKGAIDELYRRFSPMMFGVCLRYTRCRMDAEDILQEGLIKAMTNLGELREESSLGGWLRKITVNTAINYYRRKKVTSLDDMKKEEELADNEIIANISADELMKYIQELPEGYRMVFNLYVIEGYLHKEIAEKLNISESTSKTQLAKARRTLIEKINKMHYEKART